jgi:predicted GNAT family acetyltransferase
MIRRLSERDHEKCLELLKPKSAENLFILGDIEAFGYEQEFQKVWGDFDSAGCLRGVLLKYKGNYIPYAASEDFDAEGFASIISEDGDLQMLSGLKSVAQRVFPYIKRKLARHRELFYAKCSGVTNVMQSADFTEVKRAGLQDVERIMELYKQIPEFADSTETVEDKRRNMNKGVSRTYYIERDGKMVSVASTAAENSLSAMVVGVGTIDGYKRQGLASRCISKLCLDVLSEGKELCLFYDNPEAGRIYKRIGFEDLDRWMMYIY